jgi:hypothetical protein
VNLSGTIYQLKVYWCVPLAAWVMDISDSTGNPFASGIPLVTGVDLLGQLEYLGIPGALIVQSAGGDPLAAPTLANLGQTAFLFYIPFTD